MIKNTRTRCEICSKLTIKTPERRYGASVSIVSFAQVNADWEKNIDSGKASARQP